MDECHEIGGDINFFSSFINKSCSIQGIFIGKG